MADMTYADIAASGDARAWANQAAQNTYSESIMAGNDAATALAAAKFEWQKRTEEATQTGMWNGQWSNPQQQWFTGQFGQWYGPGGAPAAGSYTLPAQQFGNELSAQYGQYYAPGTAPAQGTQTLGAQNQANQLGLAQAGLTGWYNAPGTAGTGGTAAGGGQQTLAGQQQQWNQGFQQQSYEAQQRQLAQQNTQQYLQLLSSLRGPADWAKYQQVLGSTPGGMRDLYAAAMGQYTPGGGATTGVAPQAANLQTMQQQVGGYGQGGNPIAAYGQNTGMAGYNPQAQAQGGQVWGSGIGVGGQQGTPDQAVQATGNGTNMYGGQQQQYNLPAPNQISSQAWNNFTPSQQQMMLGNYEAAGWDKNDVQALYNQSLPKYGTNQATAGTWRMQ